MTLARAAGGLVILALAALAVFAPRIDARMGRDPLARERWLRTIALLFCVLSPLALIAWLAARWIGSEFAAGR
jgi:hypothetical protein